MLSQRGVLILLRDELDPLELDTFVRELVVLQESTGAS